MLCENPAGELRRNVEGMEQAEHAMAEYMYNESLTREPKTLGAIKLRTFNREPWCLFGEYKLGDQLRVPGPGVSRDHVRF